MIVVSLLLILVAVALLVLGLGAGSSAFLISSIVASLLAAVALVIGARRAANLRATTTFTHEPRAAEYTLDRDGPARRDAFPPAPASAAVPDFAPADVPDFSGAEPSAEPSAAAAKSGTFAEPPPSEPSGRSGSGPLTGRSSESSDVAGSGPVAGAARTESGAPIPRDGDLDAPPPNPEPPAGTASAEPATARPGSGADAPAGSAGSGDAESGAGAGEFGSAEPGSGEFGSGEPGSGEFGSGEFGSGDDEDPADEPPPQAIRPADAVRIARLTTDVFVVDGRPRYHLAECPHLGGRRAEALPANEAMELGFTPCSLCRPVDQLVAESARR